MFCTPAETVTARKQHTCTWCSRPILAGAEYRCWRSFDDSWATSKMHHECEGACASMMDYERDNTYMPGEGAYDPPVLAQQPKGTTP
jgi:hypothetical protein